MHVSNDSVPGHSHINSSINAAPLQGAESLRGHQVTLSSTTITQTTVISQQIVNKMTVAGLGQHQDRDCEFSVSKPNPAEVSKVKSILTYPDSNQNYSTSGLVTRSSFGQNPISLIDEDEDDFGAVEDDYDVHEEVEEKAISLKEEVTTLKEEVITVKEEVMTTTTEVMATITHNNGIEQIQFEIKETTSIQIRETVEKFIINSEENGYVLGEKEPLKETMHQRFALIAASNSDFAKKGFNLEETGFVVKMTLDQYKQTISKTGSDGKHRRLSNEDLEELKNKATEYVFNAFVSIGLAFFDNPAKKKEEKENTLIEPTVFSVSQLPPKTDLKVDIQQKFIIQETFKRISKTEIQIQESVQQGLKRKREEEKEINQEEIKIQVIKTEIKNYTIKQEGIKQDVLLTRTLAAEILNQEKLISSAVLVRAK